MPGDDARPAKRGRLTSGPLYASLKQSILARIHSGEWPPHHRVPSEAELMLIHGVSKMTANRVLRELASEGELVRIQGVGSFVGEGKGSSTLFEIRNIADEIMERGHRHHAKVVALEAVAACERIAAALDLAPGQAAYHSLIVHHENGAPVQLEDRHVNPLVAGDYLEQDFTQITPNKFLTIACPVTGSAHVVEAILPSEMEARLLSIPRSEPCLAVTRRTWSRGAPVSIVRLVYPGTRYRLENQTGDI